MKKIYLLLLLFPYLLQAQSDYVGEWYLNVGMGPSITRSADALLTSSDLVNYESHKNASTTSFKVKVGIEHIGPNFYLYSDPGISWGLSTIYTLGIRELLSDKESPGLRADINSFEFEPLRFGVGGWLNDEMGLYAGVQYNFIWITANENFVLDERETEPNVTRSTNGGNARGIGVHGFYNWGDFLFQYSVMHNWVRNSKKFNKGNALHQVFQVRYGGYDFGFLGTIEHVRIKMDEVTRGEGYDPSSYVRFGILEGISPETRGSIFNVRAGIYFAF